MGASVLSNSREIPSLRPAISGASLRSPERGTVILQRWEKRQAETGSFGWSWACCWIYSLWMFVLNQVLLNIFKQLWVLSFTDIWWCFSPFVFFRSLNSVFVVMLIQYCWLTRFLWSFKWMCCRVSEYILRSKTKSHWRKQYNMVSWP